jgi:AcrR family transcriptional regulator
VPEPEAASFIEAARRAQIVQAAIDTIAAVGYRRASLAAIAKHAGVSKSIISYHFAGKDDLIRQIVQQAFTASTAVVRPRVEAQMTAAAMLREYIVASVEFMDANRNHMIALVEIVAAFRSSEASPFGPADMEFAVDELRQLLRWGQEQGEFREFSDEVMAVAIRSIIDSLPPRIAMRRDIDLKSYAQEIGDLFAIATDMPRQAAEKGQAT